MRIVHFSSNFYITGDSIVAQKIVNEEKIPNHDAIYLICFINHLQCSDFSLFCLSQKPRGWPHPFHDLLILECRMVHLRLEVVGDTKEYQGGYGGCAHRTIISSAHLFMP